MDRALVFCTAHLQSDPLRYQLWAKYYAEAFKDCDVDLLMVNDGPCDQADRPPEAEVIALEPHLGRPSHLRVPGWKRSFTYGLRTGINRGYRWIGHVESDLYIKPGAIPEFLEHLRRDNGFGSGWCRTYGFPESSLLVLNDRRVNETLINRYEVANSWHEEIEFERMLWSLGPGRILEGDRCEGRIERLRQDDTYIAAIHFSQIERTRRVVDLALPFSQIVTTTGTETVFAGLATLNRPDCAERCINSLLSGSKVPDQILVVDNGGGFKNHFGSIVKVFDFGRNLGLAASLNVMRRETKGHDIVFLNDDVRVGERTIERMEVCPGWFVSACRFSCFLIRNQCFAHVGEFDEQFWPLYYEDTDYMIRMQIAACDSESITNKLSTRDIPLGYSRHYGGIICLDNEPIEHHDGGFRSRLEWMEPYFAMNRQRLAQKWQQVQIRDYFIWGDTFKGSPAPYLNSDHLRADRRHP